jgi:hypothetical protein
MKEQLMKFSLISLLTLVLVGCSKDDDNNNSAAYGELAAKVDGDLFKASTHVGTTFYNGFFRITAMNDLTGETITISVSNAAEGIFDLGQDSHPNNGAIYRPAGGPNYISESGEINITSLDVENGTASGTFRFTATSFLGIKEVTNGEFNNVVLSVNVPISADVDGEAFNSTIVNSGLRQSKIFIIALNGNGNDGRLSLEFPGDITVGNYEFGTSTNYEGSYYPNLGGSSYYVSESGTLTITSFNATTRIIEGTFNFTARSVNPNDPVATYEITSGSFSVEIQ